MQLPMLVIFFCINLIAVYIITKLAFFYAVKFGLLDHPGKRTSHIFSTPRGGGVSIVIVFLFTLLYLRYMSTSISSGFFLSAFIGGGVVALIGLLDDHIRVSVKWRILVHLLASVISLLYLTNFPNMQFFSVNVDLSTFAYFFYSIALVWLLNLFNFMDGIDGLASVEAITVLFGASVILLVQGDTDNFQILLLLVACILGFLIWNWPPAKIFMGDTCSGFLGFMIGLMAIWTSSTELINLWCWFILLAVFVVDATYTLIYRILKGDKFYEAHRCHAYQILSRKYNSHKKVTVGVMIINITWLLPLAFLSVEYEYWAPVFSLVAIMPLTLLVYMVGAGSKND